MNLNDTGMNRNDIGMKRNDTGMNRNGTEIDRNDKGIEWITQITLKATRVDQKHWKCVVHVIGNNMSHISIAILFSGMVSVIAYFPPDAENCALTRACKNRTVMSL